MCCGWGRCGGVLRLVANVVEGRQELADRQAGNDSGRDRLSLEAHPPRILIRLHPIRGPQARSSVT